LLNDAINVNVKQGVCGSVLYWRGGGNGGQCE